MLRTSNAAHIPANRIGEMLYKRVMVILSFTSLFSATESVEAINSLFTGRMEVFDYAVFKTKSGEFYTFEFKGENAKRLYFEEFKKRKRYEVLCLDVSFDGHRTGNLDFNRYEVMNIERFHYIRHVDCSEK
jgi:hypothetical protein